MSRLLWLVLALALVLPSRAAGDPVTVTSGFIIFTDEPGDFHFAGSGFSLGGSWFPQLLSGTFWFNQCAPCLPGSTVDFGVSTYAFSTDRSAIAGGTVNGVSYPELFYTGEVTFHGPTVLAPALDVDGRMRTSGSFTFTGRIAAFANEAQSGAPLFSGDLQGAGTAEVFFGPGERSGVSLTDLEYRFEDQAPVPEPGTIVLLATGLAAAAVRRRRGQSARDPS